MRTPHGWYEYAIEAAGAALIIASAITAATLIGHPASPVTVAAAPPWMRRTLMGVAMGAVIFVLVHSRWGRRSGAHFNPALTLGFLRLGRIAPEDALAYAAAHFAGATLGAVTAVAVLARALRPEHVNAVATVPGAGGAWVAFLAELIISFVLMSIVLLSLDRPRTAQHTGSIAALLVALFISLESPLSGTSMNPARSVGSGVAAAEMMALWVYLLAPTVGMLAAAEWYRIRRRTPSTACAKLLHDPAMPCLFCAYRARRAAGNHPPLHTVIAAESNPTIISGGVP